MYSTNAVAMKRLTVELASVSRAAISSLENCGGAKPPNMVAILLSRSVDREREEWQCLGEESSWKVVVATAVVLVMLRLEVRSFACAAAEHGCYFVV